MWRVASAQHGVVSGEQLSRVGLTASAVHQRVGSGRLHRIHHGVYSPIAPALLTREGRYLAAVLACGAGAALSHRSAAGLWEIRRTEEVAVDVIAPNRRGRVPAGIRAHRDGTLRQEDIGTLGGIPCTTLPRTLLDLAAAVPIWELRKAISEAEVLQVLDHDGVRDMIRRSRGRRGVARLRLLLEEIHPATAQTRSELERRFLRMCVRTGLTEPEVNVPLPVPDGHLEVDFLWRDARLVVEADGRRFHDTDSAFLTDRRRQQQLQLAGWRVVQCTWGQVEHEPQQLAKTIRTLLAPPTGRFPLI